MSLQNDKKDSIRDFNPAAIAPWLLLAGVAGLVTALIAYLVRGAVDVYTYVPLLIGAVGILAFAFLDPERVQSWLGSRQAKYGTNMLITSLSLVAIVVTVNYILYQASTQTTLWVDLTEDESNTLSPETLRTLQTLANPVEVRAWYGPSHTGWESTMELLEKYMAESGGLITYTKIDPDANPVLANQDGISQDGTLVFAMGEQKELVTSSTESEFTTALVKLMNPGEHKVYFLAGHGEASIDSSENTDVSTLASALRSKNYIVETLNLTQEEKIPEDASVLVLAGPKTPLLDFELTAIKEYLEAGGGLILLQNPYVVTQMNPSEDILAAYLKEAWGITLRNDIIVNLVNTYILTPIASTYPSASPITQLTTAETMTMFPTAMSVEIAMPDGKTFTPLGFVQVDAPNNKVWGETDTASVGEISFTTENRSAVFNKDVDYDSPLNIGVSAEDATLSSRVVVFGDEDFAENQAVNWRSGANRELMENAVNWASFQENLISLSQKPSTYRYISLPTDAWVMNAIVLTSACLLPGSFVALYGIVWYNRRKHK
ncbi:MAG: GldG family protein [Anaerolineales bacterium]|nr:GldG family protein [Anaerolineales bacterium]